MFSAKKIVIASFATMLMTACGFHLRGATSVTAITYKDSDGTTTTLIAGTDYLVETNGDGLGRIVLVFLVEKCPVAGRVEKGAEHGRRPRLARRRGRGCVAEGHESRHRVNARSRRRREPGRVAAGEQFPPEAVAGGGRVGPCLLHG